MERERRVFVGTGKGLFILEADGPNEAFSISAPLCDLWPINDIHASIESESIWAAGGSDDFGAGVWRSEDEGRSWRLSKLSNGNFDRFMLDYPDFAEENNIPLPEIAPHNDDVTAMWSVAMVGERLFAGGKPGRLYLSDDGGENFALVESFARQPGSDEWQPGYAGLIPHTIASAPGDARRIWIGMSAVGVFASEDGGIGWELRNRRSNTGSGPSDIGPCVSPRPTRAKECSTNKTTMGSSSAWTERAAGARSATDSLRPSASPSKCTPESPIPFGPSR